MHIVEWKSQPGKALSSVQFSSVTQSRSTLCNPMDCSSPGFLVHHQLPELAQTHVHWVSDTIQPSHPLLLPSAFNLSQLISESFPVSQFFTSGGQSIGASASVLSMTIQEMQELWETNELGLFEAICMNCSIPCIRPLGLKCSGWRGRGLSWDQWIRQKSTKK